MPPSSTPTEEPPNKVIAWIIVNILATVGIVFTNKAIFTDGDLVKMPVSFAAFHFACTSTVLYLTSRTGLFEPKPIGWQIMFPLCFVFALHVVLTNLSLAFSSVTFYQMARILMTPGTASLNWILYGQTLRPAAIFSIFLICAGVGITIYFDAISATVNSKTTTIEGVFFALSGVAVSCIYTIWIGTYAKKHACSSMQLLFNQAPISSLMLLIISPLIDTFPDFSAISVRLWFLIFLSGLFAVLINISQFYIIHGSSAVSSTIVGHAKTCLIIILGWTFGAHMNEWSILGIVVAMSGFFYYTSLKSATQDTTAHAPLENENYSKSFLLNILAYTRSAERRILILTFILFATILPALFSNYESTSSMQGKDSSKALQSHREQVIDQLYGIQSPNSNWSVYFDLLDPNNLAPATIATQTWIYNKLHPNECRNQKFVVLASQREELGLIMHKSTSILAWALENHHQIIWDDSAEGAGAMYADIGCGRGEKVGNFLCYFEAPSGCGQKFVSAKNSVLQSSITVADDFIPSYLVDLLKQSMAQTEISPAFMKFWWRSQGVAYLMRLNKQTRANLLKMRLNQTMHTAMDIKSSGERVSSAFPYPLPAKTFNAHVKHGETDKDFKAIPLSTYVVKAEKFVSENPFYYEKSLFVSSEDEEVIQETLKLKSILPETQPFLNWKVFVSHIHRMNDSPAVQLDKFGKVVMTHEWLLQLLMALECDVHIGTLGTNWNRLIAELRCIWVDKCNFPFMEVGERSTWIDYSW